MRHQLTSRFTLVVMLTALLASVLWAAMAGRVG